MARAATTTDVFNAVAEVRRREILDALVEGEASVGDLVDRLELAQPQVSKHLKVLAEVGLVNVRSVGRHRMYRLEAPALAPLQRWLATYEQLINARYDRLGDYLSQLQETQLHEPQDHEPQLHEPQLHEPQLHEPQLHEPQLHDEEKPS